MEIIKFEFIELEVAVCLGVSHPLRSRWSSVVAPLLGAGSLQGAGLKLLCKLLFFCSIKIFCFSFFLYINVFKKRSVISSVVCFFCSRSVCWPQWRSSPIGQFVWAGSEWFFLLFENQTCCLWIFSWTIKIFRAFFLPAVWSPLPVRKTFSH